MLPTLVHLVVLPFSDWKLDHRGAPRVVGHLDIVLPRDLRSRRVTQEILKDTLVHTPYRLPGRMSSRRTSLPSISSSRTWLGPRRRGTKKGSRASTNLGRSAERVVARYNKRGTAEQRTKEGKNAIKWTRLSDIQAAMSAFPCSTSAMRRRTDYFSGW